MDENVMVSERVLVMVPEKGLAAILKRKCNRI